MTDPRPAVSTSAVSPSVVGRRRRLWRLAGERGIVAGIALDHRDSLQAALARRGVTGLATDDLRRLKLRLAARLAPAATAIMLDAELGGAALVAGVVPSTVGLVMPLEAQGYEAAGDDRITSLQPGFGPTDALRWGADACKLLAPYRPDRAATATRQDATVAAAAAGCHDLGLPLVVEPVIHRLSDESWATYAAGYPGLLSDAIARILRSDADLLKLPFPVADPASTPEAAALAACRAMHERCAGTPWVLLGGGTSTDAFLDQIRIAGRAGASGFLAGRGIWGPASVADSDAAGRRLLDAALRDLERCRAAAEAYAQPLPRPDPDADPLRG